MKGITILDNDTVVVKIQKLEEMIQRAMSRNMSRLEEKLLEKAADEDKILSKRQVIEFLEISPSTFDNWVWSKRLIAHKIGDKPFVTMSNIKKAMKPIN